MTIALVDINNDNFEAWRTKTNQVITKVNDLADQNFSQDVDTTIGLTFGIEEGTFTRGRNLLVSMVAGTVVLNDDGTNIVYIDTTSGSETFGVDLNGAEPTTNIIPIFKVITASGAITSVEDLRTWAFDASNYFTKAETLTQISDEAIAMAIALG